MTTVALTKIRQHLPYAANIIFLITAATGYLPIFFKAEFYHWSWMRQGVLLGTAVLYLWLAIPMWNRLVAQSHSGWSHALYFIGQIILVNFVTWLTLPLDSSIWILMMPIIGQSVGFSWKITTLITLILLGGFAGVLSTVVKLTDITDTMIAIVTAALFVILFTQVALREQENRQQGEHLAEQLRAANQQLRLYAIQAEELATSKERNRLAREIHDSLGHYLTVINIQLSAAQVMMSIDPVKAGESLQKAQQLAQEGLTEVRRSVAALRESPGQNRPLPEAIAQLLRDTQAGGVVTEWVVQGTPYTLPEMVHLTLYRVAQEGLTNVRKHARASRVDVTLAYHPDEVGLTIVDNGVGTAVSGSGFGLMGLTERLNLVGGSLATETAVGQGFTLRATIPTSAYNPSPA